MQRQIPRCEVIPLPNHQVSFQVDGIERLCWHYDPEHPGPFFYPLVGPSGTPLTRMGHPGTASHDHHRAIWFAHTNIDGNDFWSLGGTTRVRQKQWLRYRDSKTAASMAVLLGWFDPQGVELMEQELIVELRPGQEGETQLELQSRFIPSTEDVTFGQTNFGFLAVRLAKSISEHFGGGLLTNSRSQIHEEKVFGQPAEWMDYSGPVTFGNGSNRQQTVEGITYFDHPSNPGYPAHWHVRSDGWMGASVCMQNALTVTSAKPLMVRYLLHAHSGSVNPEVNLEIAEAFSQSQFMKVEKVSVKHQDYEILRH